jgi:RHS repeat-associated protein
LPYWAIEKTVVEEGYAYIFVSNENPTQVDIHFDDLKVVHKKTNVIQYNEYYPFGLSTSASWTRENNSNNYLYNAGSEMNASSGWYDLPFRNYDAALGRFMQVDPLAVLDHSASPFVYGANNPVFFNDPMGLQAMAEWLPGVSATAYHRYNNIYGRNESGFLNEWYETFESGYHSGVSNLFNGLESIGWVPPRYREHMPRYDRGGESPAMTDPKYDVKERTLATFPILQARDNFGANFQIGGNTMSIVSVTGLGPKATNQPVQHGLANIESIDYANKINDNVSAYMDIPGLAVAATSREIYKSANLAYESAYNGAYNGLAKVNAGFKIAGAATGVASLGFATYLAVDKYNTGSFNTSTALDLGISAGLVVGSLIVGTTAAPFVIAGGLVYGIARIAAGDKIDAWIDTNFDTNSFWYGK